LPQGARTNENSGVVNDALSIWPTRRRRGELSLSSVNASSSAAAAQAGVAGQP
jgi:hypothetical protein